MLSDTIRKVNEAEQRAQDIVQEAKNKAAAIVETAREQAKQNLGSAQEQAREEAKAALVQAEKEGEEDRKQYASEIKKQLDVTIRQALEKSDAAVDAIIAGLV